VTRLKLPTHNDKHVTNGGSCWCAPTVEFTGAGHIVIHNDKDKA